MTAWLTGLHPLIRFLVLMLIVVIVVLILALVIGSLGGFDWHLDIGHFHWDIGVTKH